MSALVLFQTGDGGNNWQPMQVLPNLDETSPGQIVPAVVAGSTLVAAIRSASAIKLAVVGTGGETRQTPLKGVKVLPSLSFADVLHGWVATDTGILSTSDGGVSWVEISPKDLSRAPAPRRIQRKGTSGKLNFSPVSSTRTSPYAITAAGKDIHLGFDTSQAPSRDLMAA